eukprot:GHVS01108623.1.p1 GENE.GHVS01108623.1~~GHVS01108623.1.p1  ORF type:complete len:683 (+),score=57.16 GHVS01108623.1:62-2050(+)
MVLFMTIAMNLFLKANADTSILFMDLDDTSNSAKACSYFYMVAGIEHSGFTKEQITKASETLGSPLYRHVTFRTQTALHGLIDNETIASSDLPMFVVTAGMLRYHEAVQYVEKRKDFVAETFGVSVNEVRKVSDIAVKLGVADDPYNKKKTWPIKGYMIEKGTPWGQGWTDAICANKTSRRIFLVSTQDVVGESSHKPCVLIRLLDMALRQDAVRGKVTVHTIGDSVEDLMLPSQEGNINFVKYDPSNAVPILFELGVVNDQLNVYSEKRRAAESEENEQPSVALELKDLKDRMKDTIMKPILFFRYDELPRENVFWVKGALAQCLNDVPGVLERGTPTTVDNHIPYCMFRENADTKLLFMELDDTANALAASAGSCNEYVTSETQRALHGLIDNETIASRDLPVFFVTSGTLREHASMDEEKSRLGFVAETFGVSLNALQKVDDIALALGVGDDPYNKNGSWPILGYMIDKDAPWGQEWEVSTGKTSRRIFLVSTQDVIHESPQKDLVLTRLIDLALRQDAVKEAVAIHTIGASLQDLVFKSEEDRITFCAKAGSYLLEDVNRLLNQYAQINYSQMITESEGSEELSLEWEDVQEKELYRLNDTIMKPLCFIKPLGGLCDNADGAKKLLTRCLKNVPDLMAGPPQILDDDYNLTMRYCNLY